ncbi:MAG: hypothetical protein COU33_02990, partial [Candidatus Magasanikbacteria bacterium CG10_big_fil_rev_8_21_14_0_10_43_6]
MDHILELQEFFVEGKDHKKSHVLLHIAEPVSATEKERGFFFVVAEINNGYAEQIEALQQIIDDIESAYYDEVKDETPSLEEILQDINRRAHHVLKYEDTEISCVVGVIRDQTISLAYHGKPHALLFYPSKDTFASVLIIEEEANTTSQLFSELIEGNINPGDYVMVTSPHLLRFFSADRMRKLLGTRRVEETASHIQKVLHDLRNEYSFGGLIIHVTDKNDKPKTGKAPKSADKGSAESLEHLMASAKSTEDTLSPPLFAPISAKLKQFLAKKKSSAARNTTSKRTHKHYNVETNHRRKPEGQDESLFGKFLIGLGHVLVFIGTALTFIFKKIFGTFGYVFGALFALITNRNNGRAKTLQSWRNS